jgi:hypothetical protein
VECKYTVVGGGVRRSVYFPWASWALLALLAGSLALTAIALRQTFRVSRKLAYGVLAPVILVPAALWFGPFVPFLLFASAVVLVLGRRVMERRG